MNQSIQRLTFGLVAAWLSGTVPATGGQDPIVYFNGPSFAFPWDYASAASVDMNRDGTPDFSFAADYFICTADVPTSACSTRFEVFPLGANALLQHFSQAAILPFGVWIGDLPPTNAIWGDPARSAAVASYFISQRYGTRGYGGPLVDAGVGYVGVRFEAADGLHYGWVRLRSAPVMVVDWAYAARPDTPIAAGDMGAPEGSILFTVDFRNADGSPHGRGGYWSAGTLLLAGHTLHFQLSLVGDFHSADIGGPAPPRTKAKLVADLGQPHIAIHAPCRPRPQDCEPDSTFFYGKVELARSQVMHLLRGADYVRVDGGALVGQISPLKL